MIGVLAIQGGFAEHQKVLDSLGVANKQVRNLADLRGLTGLIIPGGESTVMAKFLFETGMGEEIKKLARNPSFKIYGTCAGMILLSRSSDSLKFGTLGLLDISVERNAYGRQVSSFITDLEVKGIGKIRGGHFIRAPKITAVSDSVTVMSEHDGVPVLVRRGNVWGGSFHPELRGENAIHRMIFCATGFRDTVG